MRVTVCSPRHCLTSTLSFGLLAAAPADQFTVARLRAGPPQRGYGPPAAGHSHRARAWAPGGTRPRARRGRAGAGAGGGGPHGPCFRVGGVQEHGAGRAYGAREPQAQRHQRQPAL